MAGLKRGGNNRARVNGHGDPKMNRPTGNASHPPKGKKRK
jgi:hypothetical protein